MAVEHIANATWRRKHDKPGTSMPAPDLYAPTGLAEVIEICSQPGFGSHKRASGSHWALSRAAISDHSFIETHDPTHPLSAMSRTLYNVIPRCMNDQFVQAMANRHPRKFEDAPPFAKEVEYFVHVETGKRIYQLYAELDQGDASNPDSLAHRLDKGGNPDYAGPWGFRTLGGAGGQTVFGALTTGTHGGDYLLRPIADDVAALHLVADGGQQFWIEPASQPEEFQLTDDDRLHAEFDPYGPFEVVRDDDFFRAAIVQVGRFGIVYSVVLRAVRQYMLREVRDLYSWQKTRALIGQPNSYLYTSIPSAPYAVTAGPNRFMQIAVCLTPFGGFTNNLCGVTWRQDVQYVPSPDGPNGRAERVGAPTNPDPLTGGPTFEFAGHSIAYAPSDADRDKAADATLLERACTNGDFMDGVIDEVCKEIEKFLDDHQVEVGSAIAAVAVIGGAAGLLALAIPLAIILALLLAFLAALRAGGGGHRLGQVMDDVKGTLLDRADPGERAAGLFAWQLIGYKLMEMMQGPIDYTAISYAMMDRHDYLDQSCNVNVDSIEVFFDAHDPMLIAFVDALIAYEIRQEFQGRAFVGYASLRFTSRTRALIGMARWDLTCAVEVAGLKDVSGVSELIDFAILLSRDRNFRGILHWGQRNESDIADIEDRFGDGNVPAGGDLGKWREVLRKITQDGQYDGFSSQFSRDTGLEIA